MRRNARWLVTVGWFWGWGAVGGLSLGWALWGDRPPRLVEVCPGRHLNRLIADGWTVTDPDGCPVARFEEE